MFKKFILSTATILTLGLGATHVGAVSTGGVSVNTTKANFNKMTDKTVNLFIKNDNKYEVGVHLQAEQLVNGKWKKSTLEDFEYVYPKQRIGEEYFWSNFKSKGKYRIKIDVIRYDKHHNEISEKSAYTSIFNIK